MALIKDGVVYRNLQEQVQKNADDIQDILEHGAGTTVVPSTQRVEGAPYVYSLNIEGDDYNIPTEGGGGGTSWGSITGNLSDQTDLYNVLNDFNERILNNGSEIEYLHTNKANQIDLETETDNRQRADQEIMAGLNEKSTVIASTQAVAGADTIHSINIDNIDYNLPEGGSGGDPVWGNITGTLSNQRDLQQALDDETSSRHLEIEALSGEIVTEANTREANDHTLDVKIDNETTRASEAEATLNTAILARATIEYVDAADQDLDRQIGDEITARTNADTNITNTILSGKKIAVVSTLPASPDVNTIYFITGA